jgi:folate-dependent phosphoribosylglycinamide formyltransferase PurN
MADALDVGLLLGGREVPRWFGDAVTSAVEGSDATVTLVVVRSDHEDEDGEERSVFEKFVSAIAGFGPLRRYREVIAGDPKEYVDVTSLDVTDEADVVEVEPERVSDHRVAVPGALVERIGRETDVVVQIGFGIISGDVLSAPDHGVLSYHHGDVTAYRGGPPAFWEYLHGRDTVGITLQRLTEQLDGGQIVATASVPVDGLPTWPSIRREMNAASRQLLVEGFERIVDPDFEASPPDRLGQNYKLSDITLPVKVRFVVVSTVRLLRWHLELATRGC